MFWNRLQKDRIRKTYYDNLINAIEKLEEGDDTYLHIVYCVFAFGDETLVRRGGQAISVLLKNYTMQQMIRLSERFRQYASLEWAINWREITLKDMKNEFETERDYIYVLILGSFHPNGYFREQCIHEMTKYPDTLPFLILRMNDWVGNIRYYVMGMIREKMNHCVLTEILIATQAFNKVKNSLRRNDKDLLDIENIMMKRIEQDISNIPLYSISKLEFSIRKNIYCFLFSEKLLDIEKADDLLSREKHSFCQSVIISGILKYYDCSMEQIDGYLGHKSFSVRRKALEYKYEILKDTWPGLEKMLLDSNHGIRDFVSFILNRHSDFNIPDFYISHLEDNDCVVPIIGVGEFGNKEMVEILKPFLNHTVEKVIKYTILSIGKLLRQDGYDLFWKYLFDSRISISKVSYQCIRNNKIHYGAKRLYKEFKYCDIWHIKRYLALLLIHENSWERVPYLLYLYQDESMKDLHDKIVGSMWIRNVYAKITKEQERLIEVALKKNEEKLPKNLVEGIRFDLKFIVDK